MLIQSGSGGQMRIYWGQSMDSYDSAIKEAAAEARKDLQGKTLEWFEVIEFRGGFDNGKPQFQTAIRVGYA